MNSFSGCAIDVDAIGQICRSPPSCFSRFPCCSCSRHGGSVAGIRRNYHAHDRGWILWLYPMTLRQDRCWLPSAAATVCNAQWLPSDCLFLPIGLSHLLYIPETVGFVPRWLPGRTFWAFLTGVGQIACGLGILFRVFPRVAAQAKA